MQNTQEATVTLTPLAWESRPAIKVIQDAVHSNAKAKGFWDQSANIPEKLALIHSEISEALEDYRSAPDTTALARINYDGPNDKPIGFPVELADAVIRIMDLAAFLGINLETAIVEKHNYNLTRPYLHGGKKA